MSTNPVLKLWVGISFEGKDDDETAKVKSLLDDFYNKVHSDDEDIDRTVFIANLASDVEDELHDFNKFAFVPDPDIEPYKITVPSQGEITNTYILGLEWVNSTYKYTDEKTIFGIEVIKLYDILEEDGVGITFNGALLDAVNVHKIVLKTIFREISPEINDPVVYGVMIDYE